MTVGELIKALQEFDPELEAVTCDDFFGDAREIFDPRLGTQQVPRYGQPPLTEEVVMIR